jgi:peptidoglycan/LPS O-acetylase OafA/YrhL
MREYRQDIDGLRAIAVLSVALYHAGFGFHGGYVGVDVFFVLSGFLITGLIVRDLEAGSFSLAGFWERRVRRILPAATAMVLVTLAVGLVVLMPEPAAKLGQAAAAQAFMVANVYFERTTGYFDDPSELLPLLHTWSLAVEEQFYVFFPLVLALAWRGGRRLAFATVVLLAFASFAWSVRQVERDQDAAFYLLPSRAWELLLGAIVALAPAPGQVSRPFRTVTSVAGLVAIGWACLTYRSSTAFPGIAAALPCVGTALILWVEAPGLTPVGRMLSIGPLRFVGLVSYSFYLWHWPALALSRCVLGEELSPIAAGLALAASFGLAVLSWRFVETPFRRPSGLVPRRTVLVRGALASVAIAALGGLWWFSDGWSSRWDAETLRFVSGNRGPRHLLMPSGRDIFRESPPTFGHCAGLGSRPSLVLWGDSHALAASGPLAEAAERAEVCGAAFIRTAQPPVPELWRSGENPKAADWNELVLEWIERTPSVRQVVLIGRWSVLVVPQPDGSTGRLVTDDPDATVDGKSAEEALGRRLAALVDRLASRGISVWIVKEVPFQDLAPEQVAIRSALGDRWDFRGVSRDSHAIKDAAVERAFAAIDRNKARIVDPSENLFDGTGVSLVGNPEGAYYYDRHHLSPRGARLAMAPVADLILGDDRASQVPGDSPKGADEAR